MLNRLFEGFYEGFQPRHEKHFADRLNNLDLLSLNPLTTENPDMLADFQFSLRVIETSALRIDKRVNDPFLTVHFVDISTGQQLKIDSSGFYSENNNKKNYPRKETQNSSFMNFSTEEFSLINTRRTQATWNELMSFKVKNEQIKMSSLLILFEVQNYYEVWTENKTKERKLNKLSWGYLRPFSTDLTHKDLLKIRLFEYKLDAQKLTSGPIEGVPLVYFDFLWFLKERYESGFLLINFTLKKKSQSTVNSFQELKDEQIEADQKKPGSINSIENLRKSDEEVQRERFLTSILYSEDEGYRLPDKLYTKLKTASFGCSALKFSNNGRFLAYTSTDKSNFSCIKIFDFEKKSEYCTLFYHTSLVHQIKWASNDEYLITCSSDKFVKLFKIPKNQKKDVLSLTKMLKYLRIEIEHPGFCYDVNFIDDFGQKEISSKIQGEFSIATCCFDGNFRVYKIKSKEAIFEESICIKLESNSFPNCFSFSKNELFLGASDGIIHRFRVDSNFGTISLVKTDAIKIQEFEEIMINELVISPDDKYLIIHARDNCIRLLDLKSGIVINRYFKGQFLKSNIKCFSSPDFRLLFSGCEAGQLRIWDVMSANLVEQGLSYSINGVVYSGDCNSKYHVVAVAGFGQAFPVALFYSDQETK